MTVVLKENFELTPTTLILPRRARFVALSSQQSHIPINAHGNETLSPGLNPGQKRGTKELKLGLETSQQSPGQKPHPPRGKAESEGSWEDSPQTQSEGTQEGPADFRAETLKRQMSEDDLTLDPKFPQINWERFQLKKGIQASKTTTLENTQGRRKKRNNAEPLVKERASYG